MFVITQCNRRGCRPNAIPPCHNTTAADHVRRAPKIKECFRDDIGCFSLPDPGEDVKSRSFDGDVTKITEGFKRLVAYYTSTVILGEVGRVLHWPLLICKIARVRCLMTVMSSKRLFYTNGGPALGVFALGFRIRLC